MKTKKHAQGEFAPFERVMEQRREYVDFRWKSTATVGNICGTFTTYMRRKAKERHLVWDLSEEYLDQLFNNQEGRCALTGVPITITTKINKQHNLDKSLMTASLDRINNAVGYVEGNVQWVHKTINRIRQNLAVPEFIAWCNKVVTYSKET